MIHKKQKLSAKTENCRQTDPNFPDSISDTMMLHGHNIVQLKDLYHLWLKMKQNGLNPNMSNFIKPAGVISPEEH